jgi:flagellin-like hook-associated protein FlgL
MSTVSTIGQNTFLNSQILNIESQLNTLSNQVSSGNKSDTFSGINTVSQISLQLTNQKTLANGYLTNISNATTAIEPMQSVLQQITDLANQIRNDALNASSDALPVTQSNATLKAQAQDALNQISNLLNTTVGSSYLFAGRATSTQPMPNFGSASNANSIVGQVANLQTAVPLTNTLQSGDQLYNAIQTFLRNGATYTAPTGATVPSAFGYAGETAEPGGSTYQFTTTGAVAANGTSITLAQTANLPAVGQYIEFGTIPPQNAAYQVTAVVGQTLTIQRVPTGTGAVTNGVDFAVPSGTSVNVISPSAVTTVESPSTLATLPNTAIAAGATTMTVSDPGNYSAGQNIEFSNDPSHQYQVTGVAGATVTFTRMVAGVAAGGGLFTAIPANSSTTVATVNTTDTTGAAAAAGATSVQVTTPSKYHVGDRVSFTGLNGPYYDVTFVNSSAGTISIDQAGLGTGGLAAAVAGGATINILPGNPPGSTIVNVPSTNNVSAGMSLKFSNSSTVYTVTRVISATQVEITVQGTAGGVGLTDPLPAPLPLSLSTAPSTTGGTDITATFSPPVPTQSVDIDNNQSVQYGIRADDPAFQNILGALFALATTNLNTTTEAGFREIATRAANDLKTGSAQVTTLASNLGVKQQTLDATQTRQTQFITTLTGQLSNLDDVDMAKAVSQLTQTQTQLQASFQLLSTMKNLTLANYL